MRHSLIICAVGFITACTTTHTVRSVGEGNWGFGASLGGPVFTDLGPPIATPNLFVGARYGLTEALDLSAAYNLTSPFIPGLGLDLIVAEHWVPVQPGIGFQRHSPRNGIALATSSSAHFISDFQNGLMIFPAVELAFGWRYNWFNPFLGAAVALNFYRPHGATDLVQLNPFLGAEFMVTCTAAVSIRLTVFDITHNLYGSQLKWVHLVDDISAKQKYGVIGLTIGFSYDLLTHPSAHAGAPPRSEP